MARSLDDAQQELDRLQAMKRAMPNEKDEAAQDVARRIAGIEAEIAELRGKGGGRRLPPAASLALLALLALALGGLAFAAAYFGGRMLTG